MKTKKENAREMKSGFKSAFAGAKKPSPFEKFANSFTGFFKDIACRAVNGSVFTKLSHFLMGFGNLARKQIIKGLIFLSVQIAFVLYMIFLGAKQIAGLITLGTNVTRTEINANGFPVDIPGDNSMLCLLYGIVAVAIIAIFIAIYLANIKSSYALDLLARKNKTGATFKSEMLGFLDRKFHITMLSPAITGVCLFTVLPIAYMILIAFTNFDIDHPAGVTLFDWVGLTNFKDIFSASTEIGKMFFRVLLWTLCWAFFATVLNYFAGIIVALLINKKGIKFKKLWRTIFALTIAIPQFISLLTMRSLLSDSGPVNSMLANFGWISTSISFFDGNVWVARITIILVNLWIGIPYTMLITSGILMNIPSELYEAAKIDGAGIVKMFFKITMPYIIFVTAPYLITQFIGNINNFNVIYLLSAGGPATPTGTVAGETDLLVTWLYKLTVDSSDYNKGSVIGILTFLICATLSLLTYRKTAAYKQEDVFQ